MTDQNSHNTDRSGFAGRLRALMDAHGGVKAFSEKAGIPYQSAKQYLSRSEPTRPVLEKIAKTAQTSLDWLILGTSNTHKKPAEDNYISNMISPALLDNHGLMELYLETNIPEARLKEINQGAEPYLSEAITLCKALEKPLPNIDSHSQTPEPITDEEFFLIPEFDFNEYNKALGREFDFRASKNLLKDSTSRAFKTGHTKKRISEIKRLHESDYKDLAYYIVRDNSLSPTIPYMSALLVDLSASVLELTKTQLIRFRETLLICSIGLGQDGSISVKSLANNETLPLTESAINENGNIIGTVVAIDGIAK